MKHNMIFRLLLLPFGLVLKLYEMANEGARDMHNKSRFKGAIIDRRCCINKSSKIERHCHILENTLILNSTINTYSYVGRNSAIQNASIGSFCSIANDVLIGLGSHPTNLFSTSPLFYRVSNPLNISLIDKNLVFSEYQHIEIGSDVWIGSRSIIMDGVKVGSGSVIAAGTVVTKDIPPYAIVGGIPAKIIRYRFDKNKINELISSRWWTWPLHEIRNRTIELNKSCE